MLIDDSCTVDKESNLADLDILSNFSEAPTFIGVISFPTISD